MSGVPWQSNWYAAAKHRPMPIHSAKTWETAVGGTRNTMRAIYGSTDNAAQDHKNDAMCKVVDSVNETTEPRRIDREFISTWDNVETYTPPTTEQVLTWARRAERMGITVEAYARDVLKLPVR